MRLRPKGYRDDLCAGDRHQPLDDLHHHRRFAFGIGRLRQQPRPRPHQDVVGQRPCGRGHQADTRRRPPGRMHEHHRFVFVPAVADQRPQRGAPQRMDGDRAPADQRHRIVHRAQRLRDDLGHVVIVGDLVCATT